LFASFKKDDVARAPERHEEAEIVEQQRAKTTKNMKRKMY